MTPTSPRHRRLSWRATLGAGLTAALALTACGQDPLPEPADVTATGTPPAMQFTSTLEVQGSQVHITYRLTNQSPTDLVAFNRVPAYTAAGTQQDDPAAVYETGTDVDGQVEISKRAFVEPDTSTKTWTVSPQIGGTIIAAGQTISEDFAVPLPLKRHHPYGDDLGDGPITLPDPATKAIFCLGIVRRADLRLPSAPTASESVSPTPSGATASNTLTVPHNLATARVQYLSCSSPADL